MFPLVRSVTIWTDGSHHIHGLGSVTHPLTDIVFPLVRSVTVWTDGSHVYDRGSVTYLTDIVFPLVRSVTVRTDGSHHTHDHGSVTDLTE